MVNCLLFYRAYVTMFVGISSLHPSYEVPDRPDRILVLCGVSRGSG